MTRHETLAARLNPLPIEEARLRLPNEPLPLAVLDRECLFDLRRILRKCHVGVAY